MRPPLLSYEIGPPNGPARPLRDYDDFCDFAYEAEAEQRMQLDGFVFAAGRITNNGVPALHAYRLQFDEFAGLPPVVFAKPVLAVVDYLDYREGAWRAVRRQLAAYERTQEAADLFLAPSCTADAALKRLAARLGVPPVRLEDCA